MITTRLLVNADQGYRQYSGNGISRNIRKKLNLRDNSAHVGLAGFLGRHCLFSIDNGMVDLDDVNFLYNLDYIPYKSDLRLPKDPQPGDWISLYYNQEDMALKLNFDQTTMIKIHGRGNRIMGYDEPLVCDMQFSSLKLLFVDTTQGWVLS